MDTTQFNDAQPQPTFPQFRIECGPNLVPGQSGTTGVLKKLSQLRKAVPYIQRDAKNSFHKYNYVSEAKVKDYIGPAMADLGLVLLISVAGFNDRERARSGDKGGVDVVTTTQLNYRIIDSDDNSAVQGQFFGAGSDALDKGLQKAITGALKNLFTSMLMIPTGDDPDAGPPEVNQAQAAAAQQAPASKPPVLAEAPPINTAAAEATTEQRPGANKKPTEDEFKDIKRRMTTMGWSADLASAALSIANIQMADGYTLKDASTVLKDKLTQAQWMKLLDKLEALNASANQEIA